MKKLIYTAVFIVVLLVELFMSAQPLLTGNAARVPYRRQERWAAIEAVYTNRSPETEAALQKEWRLAARYETMHKLPACALVFAAFLVLDVIFIYPLWRRRSETNTEA